MRHGWALVNIVRHCVGEKRQNNGTKTRRERDMPPSYPFVHDDEVRTHHKNGIGTVTKKSKKTMEKAMSKLVGNDNGSNIRASRLNASFSAIFTVF
jgi:hypothetical protein